MIKPMLMRNALAIGWACCGLISAGPVFASEDLFKKSNCMACHAVDQKRFGPALKDVAAKYNGDATAVDKLAKKIKAGGAGVWGQAPMPPQPQVSIADATKLAEYILAIK